MGREGPCILQEAESKPEQPRPAEKPTFEDDFFDSISSDATGAAAASSFCTAVFAKLLFIVTMWGGAMSWSNGHGWPHDPHEINEQMDE